MDEGTIIMGDSCKKVAVLKREDEIGFPQGPITRTPVTKAFPRDGHSP